MDGVCYLVISKGGDLKHAPYDRQYQLFHDYETACQAFKKEGWTDRWGIGIRSEAGVATEYKCGDVDLMLLPVRMK